MKNILKKEQGITLVALVTTIIVLLIISGITIGSLTSKKGLINEANQSSENAQKESIIEKIEADLYSEKTITGKIPDETKLIEIARKYGTVEDEKIKIQDAEYEIDFSEIEGWKRDSDYFIQGNVVFNGNKYKNTDIKLFSKENINKDFEIKFTFVDCKYVENGESLLSIKDENEDGTPFFRIVVHDNKFKVTTQTNPNPGTSERLSLNKDDIISIKKKGNLIVFFKNSDVYTIYEIDEEHYSDALLTFGASLDANGTPCNFYNGEISNIEVKLGKEEYKETKTENSYNLDGIVDFDGTNYIDTGLKFFNEDNFDRDFEMTFYVINIKENLDQATLMNAKDEKGTPWPGFLVRYYNTTNTYSDLEVNASNTARKTKRFTAKLPKKIKIKRVSKKFYYSIDDANFVEFIDFTNIAWKFDVPLTFGASLDGSRNPQRYFKGMLCNISVKFTN